MTDPMPACCAASLLLQPPDALEHRCETCGAVYLATPIHETSRTRIWIPIASPPPLRNPPCRTCGHPGATHAGLGGVCIVPGCPCGLGGWS